ADGAACSIDARDRFERGHEQPDVAVETLERARQLLLLGQPQASGEVALGAHEARRVGRARRGAVASNVDALVALRGGADARQEGGRGVREAGVDRKAAPGAGATTAESANARDRAGGGGRAARSDGGDAGRGDAARAARAHRAGARRGDTT